ncbi:MAG TPA: WD40 repeat domain-containing protein [Chitinophagales bacterium]|nr:WD40 repeat domain-containing protein [Chitinophagales bacterium]
MMPKMLSFVALLLLCFSVAAQEKREEYQSPLFGRINIIKLSPDNQMVAASDTAGYVFFWNRNGSLRKILRAHDSNLTDLAFSPDGNYFATSSINHRIFIWEFATGAKVAAIESEALTLSFSPDGDDVYFTNSKGIHKASLKEKNAPLTKVYAAQPPLLGADEADDYKHLAAAQRNTLGIFTIAEGEKVAEAGACEDISGVEMKGKLICCQCANGNIELYELHGGSLEKYGNAYFPLAKDSKFMITDDKNVLIANNGKVVRWNPPSGKFFEIEGLPAKVTSLGYGDNGIVYAGDNKGKITSFQAEKTAEADAASEWNLSAMEELQEDAGIAVEMTNTGIPKSVNGRPVQVQQPVEVSSASLDIYLWDDEHEDGDTVSLNLNGKWILQNFMVTSEKKKLTVTLAAGTPNYLMLYAHNLGKFPPNTAVISFHDGKSEKRLTLESDLKHCDAVSFLLKK